jgi:hypothetical protein
MSTLPSSARARAVWPWALAVTVVLLLVLMVVLVVHALQTAGGGGNEGGISLAQFKAVAKGESQSVVESKLGKPLSQRDVEYPNPPAGDTCIYYSDSAGALQGGSTFRFCFRGGLLDFKDGSGADFDNQ